MIYLSFISIAKFVRSWFVFSIFSSDVEELSLEHAPRINAPGIFEHFIVPILIL